MSTLKVSRSVLEGKVSISGAKNSALRLLAATLLTKDPVTLTNYPSALLDAQIHVGMLEALGKKCTLLDAETILIEEVAPIKSHLIWHDRSIRNTLLILGALTARTGSGRVPLPGGCKLGDRSYDIHEFLLGELGAEVGGEGTELFASVDGGRLKGTDIKLRIRSTGATENAILSATLAKGVTRIWNPHIRPEILDLIALLRKMGAVITVYGQEHIEVIGSDALGGATHAVMPDNMEAITWLIASVVTGGDIEIFNFPMRDLEVAMIHLRESGARFFVGEDSLIVRGGRCYPIEISTGPHPGINSDVQPVMAAYAACARGESVIVDLRFPGRYAYAEEMAKMGVSFAVEGNLLKIFGADRKLVGAEVRALDLRAGAALTLCGLVADGETTITEAWQIERGYNNFVEKLNALGGNATIERERKNAPAALVGA
ncbi:UDP-N-acetylglucosamine 1-carboxyvinyltransferase [Mesorhizobium sp. BR1-1-16]|uniref:UDP-N-acetylglucosamine 1-carboxyvinyltransferase n=1 Tax=Mesorhizobium sp. BR1-1-16 TaxID=2876653 RepID=UPI001CCED59B|nr:UDP-N-acetylglucosamine 1-carboxyvinyltransferase [Mesorhizobium sp. BR1-1-16]MBZ9937876.1 UDP-N-acetylglucosamine 1-carboxyvinyltransferase [Mesorhizobium sp. BR1-1-16]